MALRFLDTEQLASGVPLGGFGCGALQVFPDGTRGCFTGLNNWEKPLGQLHGLRYGTAADFRYANPLGVFASWEGRTAAKLLQRTPLDGCPAVHAIRMEADFPIATLSFQDADLPIQVTLQHFCPFIPHRPKHSSLPVVLSLVRLTNPHAYPVTAAVLACCVNAVGSWNVGRYNRITSRAGIIGLECCHRRCTARDERSGELALVTDARAAEVTYQASWMYATAPFHADREHRRLEGWRSFAREGRLPNHTRGQEATGELDEPMGAVAVRICLAPSETREVAFAYSWFTPNHLYGHRYERWFSSAWDVARYAIRRRRVLLDETQRWQRTIRSAGLPEWLADGLMNTLSAYTAASWWTRDGRFAICENPVKWPLMDSLDVRYYGTLPLACWFPRFEQSTLLQFAKAQRADGRIPHDLGRAQLDAPSDGTTAGVPWKDLGPKFALMAYRDALWHRDRTFLARIYPHVRRAMRWEFTTDRNGDGLPDNEGADTTYDLWSFYGASSYTSSIFLAALRASERLAQMMGDRAFAQLCRQWFLRGATAFEDKLWAGFYYLAARHDDGSCDAACIAGQLNGQWYAHLLDLGYVVPAVHVARAVETMLALNGRASRFGAVNAVLPDGRIDRSSFHGENIWPGETYALSALAIYEGLTHEGLALSERMWQTFAAHARNVWSQPDVVNAHDGSLGDGEFYVRNVAIWALPFAMARRDRRVRRMLQSLTPHLRFRSVSRAMKKVSS